MNLSKRILFFWSEQNCNVINKTENCDNSSVWWILVLGSVWRLLSSYFIDTALVPVFPLLSYLNTHTHYTLMCSCSCVCVHIFAHVCRFSQLMSSIFILFSKRMEKVSSSPSFLNTQVRSVLQLSPSLLPQAYVFSITAVISYHSLGDLKRWRFVFWFWTWDVGIKTKVALLLETLGGQFASCLCQPPTAAGILGLLPCDTSLFLRGCIASTSSVSRPFLLLLPKNRNPICSFFVI